MGWNWRDKAACLGEDPELFFPTGKKGAPALAQIQEAKRVCGRCPVRRECRCAADTVINGSPAGEDGVWGGSSADERAADRRAQRRRAS